jgi:drug/metabolite transporter (DMT)-like permease
MAAGAPHARRGLVLGLAAAASFAIAAPVSKLLLDDIAPQLLAGLLSLGAGLGLAAVRPFRSRGRDREAPLRRADATRLAGLILSGGVVAPVLLLIGLERVSGTAGSLLLNLEAPATVVIGLVVFGEHLGRRGLLSVAAVVGGGVVLCLPGASGGADLIGVACIAVACGGWGIDNNLTQSLTLRDPFAVVGIKVSVAASVNVTLALLRGDSIPDPRTFAAALALGAVAYGASVVLDAYALRLLGAARESIVFATAPFLGALLALPILSESLTAVDALAGSVMGLGVVLLFRERHQHRHLHQAMDHEHVHTHDEHHQHVHEPRDRIGEPHSHVHHHEPLAHSHTHVSDLHHRHRHR